jgi:hypothetical protein
MMDKETNDYNKLENRSGILQNIDFVERLTNYTHENTNEPKNVPNDCTSVDTDFMQWICPGKQNSYDNKNL